VRYFLVLSIFVFSFSLNAANSENEIKAAVLGKLSHFIKHKSPMRSDEYVIKVFQNEAFATFLQKKYNHKTINNKNVIVKNVQTMEELNSFDILYIGEVPHEIQYQLIKYAQHNNLLTIGEGSGFAERGGTVQLYFVSQKIRFKINLNAAKKSNLKISSSLLSMATIVKSENK